MKYIPLWVTSLAIAVGLSLVVIPSSQASEGQDPLGTMAEQASKPKPSPKPSPSPSPNPHEGHPPGHMNH
ncbi:MAG: hypothetical protein VKL20_05250 [Synechocystis sp.]|nr:hypothetical protein [Synechocystis sp.]